MVMTVTPAPPSLSTISGTLGLTHGGTGKSLTPTDGQILIGKTSDNSLNAATVTAGSNISITNGAGSLRIAVSGGGGTGAGGLPYPAFTSPPLVANWTWVNQGSATASDQPNALTLTAPLQAGGTASAHILARPIPGLTAPWTVTAVFNLTILDVNFATAGILWRDSATGRLVIFGLQYNSSPFVTVTKYTNPTTSGAAYLNQISYHTPSATLLFMRVQDDGVNRIASVSADGYDYQVLHTVTRLDWLTNGADQVGIYVDPFNGSYGTSLALYSWVEQTV